MKALLTNYRQSPRKVRLVASLISGKTVKAAETELRFLPKRAAEPIAKLLSSAVANAKAQGGIEKENLIVKSVTVDKGTVLKRMMPRARGSGARINKRSSHITLILVEGEVKSKKAIKASIKESKVVKAKTKKTK